MPMNAEAPAASAQTTTARFRRHQAGATSIEYALMASLIGAVVAATVWQIGGIVLTDLFMTTAAAVAGV